MLHPGRTLLEKLVLIHELARRLTVDASRQPDRRSGRHFYDVFQLLGDNRVRAVLAEREEVESVLGNIAAITRAYFGGGDDIELRPAGGFASSPAFDPGTEVSARLRAAYEATMPELYFGVGPLPTWDEICSCVAGRRELL